MSNSKAQKRITFVLTNSVLAMLRSRICLCWIFILTIISGITAQNGLPAAAGNRGMAMGGTGISFQDHHAVWTNPAGLASLNSFGLNLAGEQRFGLSELQQIQLGAALPTSLGGFGINLTSFGYGGFRESRIGIAYGRSLSDNFRIGGEFIGLNTGIEGYDSRFNATFSIGMQIDLLPELTVGFRAYSPLRVETVEGEFLPQLFSVGFGYKPNKKLLLTAQVDQDLDVETRVRAGLEYLMTEAFTLRLGVSSGPAELSFGVDFRATEQINIQLAARYHEILGITPGVGVVYVSEK